ncbi:hypothetical protein Tco_0194947 [Tanacetum coccineum]
MVAATSNSNTDGLAAMVSKLDNLGRDIRKLKENVHAIQVGCQICEGPHLDKECPLNEEVKQVEEVKYGEFRHPAPFNGGNGAKSRVGPLGYYTRTNNRPPYGEKRLSLEELMNKHQDWCLTLAALLGLRNSTSEVLRMTKVIKGEFEKIKDVKVEDVSLTCDTSLKVFNDKVNRLSGMDDDSEHEADNDMGYDSSDVAFTEWLGSKFFNYKTMDHYIMKALWIYWIRGNDEVELTLLMIRMKLLKSIGSTLIYLILKHLCARHSKNLTIFCKLIQTYLLRTLRDSRPMNIKRMIGSINGTRTYHGSMRSHGLTLEFGPNTHQLNILANLPTIKLDVQNGQHVVGRMMDTVMEETYPELTLLETNSIIRITGDNEREELCEVHELPVCNVRRYRMIKYSFNNDKECVAVKEDEYDDLTIRREEARRAYQEIFRIMDEGWMVTRAE